MNLHVRSRASEALVAPCSSAKTPQISKTAAAKATPLATQVLAISMPRNLSVDIALKGDELKREDLTKIKSQFNRWIEGLEEAFE